PPLRRTLAHPRARARGRFAGGGLRGGGGRIPPCDPYGTGRFCFRGADRAVAGPGPPAGGSDESDGHEGSDESDGHEGSDESDGHDESDESDDSDGHDFLARAPKITRGG